MECLNLFLFYRQKIHLTGTQRRKMREDKERDTFQATLYNLMLDHVRCSISYNTKSTTLKLKPSALFPCAFGVKSSKSRMTFRHFFCVPVQRSVRTAILKTNKQEACQTFTQSCSDKYKRNTTDNFPFAVVRHRTFKFSEFK